MVGGDTIDIINNNINDILDYKGENNNFINGKPYSDEYKQLAQKWSKLPLYKDTKKVKEFFNLLHNKQVILLVSGTGSGKTVLVPKFFLKYVITMNLSGKIGVTNPKILTTKYNAEYGAKTLDIKLGEEVGYKYKGSPSDSVSQNTRLLYATDGLILAQLLSGDTTLKDYQGIIIDEAHERHVQIDILIKMLKEVLFKRPDFKLIIMSATINSEVFRNYFNVKGLKYGEIEVTGESNFPISRTWLKPNVKVNRSNYVNLAVEKCIEILNRNDTGGDIIVFIATTNDAINGCQMLKQMCPSKLKATDTSCNQVFCVEVYAKMKQVNKELAVSKDLYKQTGFKRKVIFATNVAESSITFDGLVYVIDSGYELGNYYDVSDNSYVVSKMFTSQAQVKQRMGRAGRTQPGICFHLYTEDMFNKFKMYPEPNISVMDLTEYILSFIKYSKTIKGMLVIVKDLLTIPSVLQIVSAIYKLHFLKCIKIVKAIDSDKSNLVEANGSTLKALNNNYDNSEMTDTLNFTDVNIDMSSIYVNFSNNDFLSSPSLSSPQDKSNPEKLFIDEVKWSKINSFDKINETINGSLTVVGFNILKFKSSPVISSYAIIISKYMNCQEDMIKLMAIIEMTDGKIDSLFSYNKKKEETEFKNYFSKEGYNGSDHLTILNIYNNHYLQKNNKFLNKRQFEGIEDRVKQLTLYANSIEQEKYEHMNDKYYLIKNKSYDDKNKNILFILAMSHYYNMLTKENRNMYTTVNYLKNSIASLEFSDLTPDNNSNNSTFAICHVLSNVFGKKNFQCNTKIPNDIMKDIIKEDLYFNHKSKFKKLI